MAFQDVGVRKLAIGGMLGPYLAVSVDGAVQKWEVYR